MKTTILAVVLLSLEIAHAQTLRVTPVAVVAVEGVSQHMKFYCAAGYNPQNCKEDILKLRDVLAHFPVAPQGEWSFVIVPSQDWSGIVSHFGGATVSPAFTILENRTTVLEQAVFSASGNRALQLMKEYGALGDKLLQLALAHELGHAVCGETNEYRADAYGGEILKGRVPVCKISGSKR